MQWQKLAGKEQYRIENHQTQKSLIEQRNNTHADYAWLPALLFLAAGIVFIAGDISISGLQQVQMKGFFEEWGLPESQYHFES